MAYSQPGIEFVFLFQLVLKTIQQLIEQVTMDTKVYKYHFIQDTDTHTHPYIDKEILNVENR